MAVEHTPFELLSRVGDFEIRAYGALAVAEVQASGDQTEAAGQGFRRLARYINRGNARRQAIAMTAPVSQTREGAGWIVRFTLPRSLAPAEAPRPDDDRICVKPLAPGRVAAVRFSGVATSAATTKQTARLNSWARARGLQMTGAPWLAQYDPPWTLWFLRHNEILLPIR